jgi:hypothetical protein
MPLELFATCPSRPGSGFASCFPSRYRISPSCAAYHLPCALGYVYNWVASPFLQSTAMRSGVQHHWHQTFGGEARGVLGEVAALGLH